MKQDTLDRWLKGATFAVALVRVLRGDDPAAVVADVELMNERAAGLKKTIDDHMRAPSSAAPSSPGSSPGGGADA